MARRRRMLPGFGSPYIKSFNQNSSGKRFGMFPRRYWPAIPIAAVFVVAAVLEWQHAHGPRQPTYAAATQNPTAAPSETYKCRIPMFEGPDRDANQKPWVVKDGKIILGYHGDLVPAPPMSFPIVKDDADQLVGMRYVPYPGNKDQNQILILMIDKNTSKVAFLMSWPDARYIEHQAGSCTKP